MNPLHQLRDEVLTHAKNALTATAIPRVDLYRVSQPLLLPPDIYPPFLVLSV